MKARKAFACKTNKWLSHYPVQLSLVLFVSGLVLAARQHQHLQHMARRQLGRRIRDTDEKAGCVSTVPHGPGKQTS